MGEEGGEGGGGVINITIRLKINGNEGQNNGGEAGQQVPCLLVGFVDTFVEVQ